jgi:hypothetical protein
MVNELTAFASPPRNTLSMSIRIGRVGLAAAFAILLSSTPGTGLAYPLTSPSTLTTTDTNPVRSLLNVLGTESGTLWASLDDVYTASYVETSCQQPC